MAAQVIIPRPIHFVVAIAMTDPRFLSTEPSPVFTEELFDRIADALADKGYLVLDNPLPQPLVDGLLLNLQQQITALNPAGVGRQGDYQRNQQIRGDSIQWLEPGVPAVTEFLSAMDKLREAMNQRLYLGLVDYESHYAVYEPGAFYQKHRDAFRGKPGRKLSSVFYLNPDWDTRKGGELVLYDEAGELELLRVAPECGRLVLFLSEDFPHEVLPASVRRQSIAGWFRIKPL
uniref:2OG-Fe(II) oxygenase n=1 Tax=Cellvibrio fontiphilus TaxID=1815559 RepID=UPI002B4BF688|nr:2OG-Fe(II) oxygenase [Cellvibrio fontiphilus]